MDPTQITSFKNFLKTIDLSAFDKADLTWPIDDNPDLADLIQSYGDWRVEQYVMKKLLLNIK